MATESLSARSRFLAFPFRMTREGAAISGRQAHIREQIAMLLHTQPQERVFLPDFGIGIAQLLFLPMTETLWRRIEVSLASGVARALAGEVLPESISVSVGPATGQPEVLRIVVRYTLAALNLSEETSFDVSDGALIAPGQSIGTGGG